jgi:hypothetical protein
MGVKYIYIKKKFTVILGLKSRVVTSIDLASILVVREFQDVFLGELLGFPLVREIKISIETILGMAHFNCASIIVNSIK